MRMNVGTKSLLFGVHQFIWHPLTVARAWRETEGRWPTWREWVCIVIHDWGYWGLRAMDDEVGEKHPERGAFLAARLLGDHYGRLVLLHSRHYARTVGMEPSALCWADKLSILYDPPRFYLLRARLSGEIGEYRMMAHQAGVVPLDESDEYWLVKMRERFHRLASERRGDVVTYHDRTSA